MESQTSGCPAGGCENCSGCAGGTELVLTPGEVALLLQLGKVSFLPVCHHQEDRLPVYREEQACTEKEYAAIINALWQKRLISLDYDLPLTNFPYDAYTDCPVHGSMALTLRGQTALELLEVQGMDDEESP
ncbi:MAG: hypothetical protein LIO51_01115 [Clostridiales bacterium]|nr:hypothetical protein [Clostridiales bacterium]